MRVSMIEEESRGGTDADRRGRSTSRPPWLMVEMSSSGSCWACSMRRSSGGSPASSWRYGPCARVTTRGEPMGRHTHSVAAHNAVYFGAERPSQVVLPVIPGDL